MDARAGWALDASPVPACPRGYHSWSANGKGQGLWGRTAQVGGPAGKASKGL